MKKIFHLSTCSTCSKILSKIQNLSAFDLQDIKTNKLDEEDLNEMRKLAGSYESLFSKRAIKYRSLNLKEKKLSEEDYKRLILEEYTFLKRPVIMTNGKIFIGNAPSTVQAMTSEINHES